MTKVSKNTDTPKILSAQDILGAKDIVIELVPCPEWGGNVYVKGLTGDGASAFTKSITDDRKGKQVVNLSDIREKLFVKSVCDESGNLLFSGKDVSALREKSSAPIIRCFKVAQRLSGLGDEDINELADNLENDPKGDSASD